MNNAKIKVALHDVSGSDPELVLGVFVSVKMHENQVWAGGKLIAIKNKNGWYDLLNRSRSYTDLSLEVTENNG